MVDWCLIDVEQQLAGRRLSQLVEGVSLCVRMLVITQRTSVHDSDNVMLGRLRRYANGTSYETS